MSCFNCRGTACFDSCDCCDYKGWNYNFQFEYGGPKPDACLVTLLPFLLHEQQTMLAVRNDVKEKCDGHLTISGYHTDHNCHGIVTRGPCATCPGFNNVLTFIALLDYEVMHHPVLTEVLGCEVCGPKVLSLDFGTVVNAHNAAMMRLARYWCAVGTSWRFTPRSLIRALKDIPIDVHTKYLVTFKNHALEVIFKLEAGHYEGGNFFDVSPMIVGSLMRKYDKWETSRVENARRAIDQSNYMTSTITSVKHEQVEDTEPEPAPAEAASSSGNQVNDAGADEVQKKNRYELFTKSIVDAVHTPFAAVTLHHIGALLASRPQPSLASCPQVEVFQIACSNTCRYIAHSYLRGVGDLILQL